MGRDRSNAGFTLIEMLVVISIMGVLAALILPAMAHAKEKAKTLYCQNNLKQLSIALQSYCNHNNGSFPALMDNPYWGYALYPVELMAMQMGLLNDRFSQGARPPKVVLCPSCKITVADGDDFAARHYAYNAHLDSWAHSPQSVMDYITRVGRDSIPDGWSRYPWPEARQEYVNQFGLPSNDYWCCFQPLKSSHVTAPANVMVFMDSNDEQLKGSSPSLYDWRMTAVGNYYDKVPNRHNGGGNMSFLDGHVEWKDREFFIEAMNQWDWLIRSDLHDTTVWELSTFNN